LAARTRHDRVVVERGYLIAVSGATRLPPPRSDDCCCRSTAAYSSDKCPFSSQLTSISGDCSPICHLGRQLIAGSSATTKKL